MSLILLRAIAADPEVLLMDEPCSALDTIATARIEELIDHLRGQYSIVIVTHNMQQAARVFPLNGNPIFFGLAGCEIDLEYGLHHIFHPERNDECRRGE